MIDNPMFKGSWASRIECLFGGYDIADKRVLDIGCNMGVVGYEICKHGPAHYTGVDRLSKHLAVARALFHGIETPHEFHDLDLVMEGWHCGYQYDVVFLLAVWHHLVKGYGRDKARATLMPFFDKVTHTVVVRGPPDQILTYALYDAGLRLCDIRPSSMGLHPLAIYAR